MDDKYYQGPTEDTSEGREIKGQLGKQEPKEETLDVTIDSVDPKPLTKHPKGQFKKLDRDLSDGQDTGAQKNAV